ncbi:hypothetical protein [Arthrobacter woluwensis]|uniref:hypothetical protein n=1 Tax=Arthrobacter woluwensis TaxID=156980 RepID=UPI003825CC99
MSTLSFIDRLPTAHRLTGDHRDGLSPQVLAAVDHILSGGAVYLPFARLGHRTAVDRGMSPQVEFLGQFSASSPYTAGVLLKVRFADDPFVSFWVPADYLAHGDCRTCRPLWDEVEALAVDAAPGTMLYGLTSAENGVLVKEADLVRAHAG